MAVDELSIPGSTGIASVLRVWYFNDADQVFNNTTGLYETWSDGNYANYQVGAPASATPIAEDGTTARYKLTRPAGVITPGSFEWHKVVGGTPSTDPQMGAGSLDDASVTVQGGTPLPSTRRLYFRLKVAGVYTDPTGNTVTLRDPTQTFGVKRQDTGAVVVGVSPLQTYVRESVGSYYYEIAETGLALLYGAEYIDPSTSALVRQLMPVSTAPPAQVNYTTADNLAEYGRDNRDITANLSNSGLFEDSPAIILDAIAEAYGQSNVILSSANPRPDTFPVVSSFAWVNDIITRANTIIAWGALLNRRDDQGGSRDANGMTGGDRMMQKGLQMLRDLIATTGGIPGVGEVVEERAGSFEFVTIVRDACTTTGDENARPLLWY